MRSRSVRKARPAFTLLEMILAAAIAVLLLGALYVAVDLQLRHASAARDVVERTTLARTLLKQIANDIAPDLATADPMRYQQGGQSGAGGAGAAGASGGGTSSSASSSSSGSSSDASAGSASATAGNNIASSSSTFSSMSGTAATSSPNGLAVLALQGTSNTLTLYVSRVPTDPKAGADNPLQQQPGVSDQHRIVYWLADGVGLARQDVVATTSEDALNQNVPSGAPDQYTKVLAKEVTDLQFQYFDGSEWQDSWDGTQVGADGVTPIGPPLAVAITIKLRQPGTEDVKQYRHVVAIPTANGTTTAQQQSSTAGSGSGSSSGSSGP